MALRPSSGLGPTLLVAALAALGTGCGEPPPRAAPDAVDLPLRGTKTIAPLGKVPLTLLDAHGRPYAFVERTRGTIALLFFGYTYCPDICPVHMATLAAALAEVDPEVRERVEVVFVTVDPERDTPERLRRWLAAFDSSFVGLRGTPEEIEQALAYYRYPPPERSDEGPVYTVGHPALVYAFTPDGLGRSMYGVETSRGVWVHDLSLMASYPWEEPSPAEGAGDARTGTRIGSIEVLDPRVAEPAAADRTALYVTLRNHGSEADTLIGVSFDGAARGSVHVMEQADGMMRMRAVAGLELPPGGSLVLAPGGAHGMLEGLRPGSLAADASVRIRLHLARTGTLVVTFPVLPYAQIAR